ncbi:hypothetical protein SELMODRAFT_422943 [Selaginella moellendorffii]|uniref:Uncharacterized protein n=1 Tax=Selaginella moellendorffii TaxID=88036 RepID=D8SK22_SELML|nr:hypothetical protein SELMODRAFT_422943 [Selaginella moellendorffii]
MSRDGFPQPGTRIPPFLDAAGLFSELQDDEVGRGHGDNARNGLEIHGFPAIGQRNPLEREDYTAWPSLPGACEFREKSCSWAAESCPWQGNFGRSTSRCRQAAFDNSSNPSSPEEPNGFASRDAGKGALSAPPPPPSGYLPPVYLMLNKDFVVISPLKENLLLTLALAEHRRPSTPPSFDEASSAADLFETSPESFLAMDSSCMQSLSVEYFVRKFKATDVVTEMEVEYCAMNWKKVDYICNLYGQRVGVSVTRAMSYPNPEDFSPQMAYRLLYKKLFGLVVARHGVTDRHSFSQCVLHVWCETTTTAKLLQAQYKGMRPSQNFRKIPFVSNLVIFFQRFPRS